MSSGSAFNSSSQKTESRGRWVLPGTFMERLRRSASMPVIALLHAYKSWISPLLPPACRYIPTCSEYALEAVERYGVLRGGLIATWRVLRCHPLAKAGYDPVPRPDQATPGPESRPTVPICSH